MWRKVDEYRMRIYETHWTITYSKNALFPYGLYYDSNLKGNFKTLPEAIEKHRELSQYA